jgi:hypothetical protein
MNEKECMELIDQGESAYGLLFDADPKIIKRFEKTTTNLVKILEDTRKHFPDACYYTASGGLHLMIGSDHNDKGWPQPHLVAVGADPRLVVGDGDF